MNILYILTARSKNEYQKSSTRAILTFLFHFFIIRSFRICLLTYSLPYNYLHESPTPGVPKLPQFKATFHPCLGITVTNTLRLSSLCWWSNYRSNCMRKLTCIHLLWMLLCQKTYVTDLLMQKLCPKYPGLLNS